MARQRYDIVSARRERERRRHAVGLASRIGDPVGTLKAGDEMRARVAIFIESGDGKICHQRDYGWYEPL